MTAETRTDSELLAAASDISETQLWNALKDAGTLFDLARNPAAYCKRAGMTQSEEQRLREIFEISHRINASKRPKLTQVTCPQDIADLMMPKLRHLNHEVCVVIALDTKGKITRYAARSSADQQLQLQLGETNPASQPTADWGRTTIISESDAIFRGSLNSSMLHPREIFRFAIQECANSIILVHNHPSGDPEPSSEDIRATKQLMAAGQNIGIKVLDHVIIGDGKWVSLQRDNHV